MITFHKTYFGQSLDIITEISLVYFQFGVGILSILLGRAAVISNGITESDDDIRKSW